MRRALFVLLLWFPLAKGADFPATWAEFSAFKPDAALVASIKKKSASNLRGLCVEYGQGQRAKKETRRHAAISAYFESINFINGIDLGGVGARRVEIGMTACGVFAALGEPDVINSTRAAYGDSMQIVYRSRKMYIYARRPSNGDYVVHAIQE